MLVFFFKLLHQKKAPFQVLLSNYRGNFKRGNFVKVQYVGYVVLIDLKLVIFWLF